MLLTIWNQQMISLNIGPFWQLGHHCSLEISPSKRKKIIKIWKQQVFNCKEYCIWLSFESFVFIDTYSIRKILILLPLAYIYFFFKVASQWIVKGWFQKNDQNNLCNPQTTNSNKYFPTEEIQHLKTGSVFKCVTLSKHCMGQNDQFFFYAKNQ